MALGYLNGLAEIGKTLADGIADALNDENHSLADAVQTYATGVATTRKEFAYAVATMTADHDKAVTDRTKTYRDQISTRQQTRDDAVDAAQWGYERLVAEHTKTLAVTNASIDYDLAMGTITSEAADTQRATATASYNGMVASYEAARKGNVATAEAARVNGHATDHKNWVADVGQKNVDLATAAKAAIDQLASDLKAKEDSLTSDEADAAKALAAALANDEKTSQINSAEAGADYGNGLAPIDGTDGIDATERDNDFREKLVHNRSAYETEIRQDHKTKMLAASVPDSGLQNLVGFQRSAATADVTWSTSKGQAIDVYEQALSTAYAQQANGMGGAGGADIVVTTAQGATDVAAVTAQANADATYSINATGHLADYSEQSSSAATKSLREGVKAETNYDVKRVTAQKEYDDALETANVTYTAKYVEIEVAIYLGDAIPHVPSSYQNPPGTTDETNRENRIAKARETIEAEYQASAKTARAVFAGKVGDGQISRAGELGDTMVTEATEQGDESVFFAENSADDNAAYESAITTEEVARVTSEGAYDTTYSNRLAQIQKDLTAAIGSANVGLTQSLGTPNVTKTTSLATAESTFWSAERSATVGRYTTWLGSTPTTHQTFLAAQASAQSQWTTGMAPAYVAYSTAIAQAGAAQDTALAQAVAAQDNALESANVGYVAATEPLYSQASIDRMQAERDWIEDTVAADDAHWLAKETAQNTYDVSIAGAAKTQGISYATAEKSYQVAIVTAESSALSGLLHTHDVAFADADVAKETTAGDSDVTWTTGVAGGDKTWRKTGADADHAFRAEQVRIDRDLIVAISAHDAANFIAQSGILTTFWSAETAAANTYRTAEYQAAANYEEASNNQKTLAISNIEVAIPLAWTEFEVGLALAKQGWFVDAGRSLFLAMGSSINGAETVYQTAVNSLFTAWAADAAAAQTTYVATVAGNDYASEVEKSSRTKQRTYQVADADEVWQLAAAAARRESRISTESAHRNFVNTGDSSALTTALLAVTAASLTAKNSAAHAYTVSEALATGSRRESVATADVARHASNATAKSQYVQENAHADAVFLQGIAALEATRTDAILTASTTYEIQTHQGVATAFHLWAIDHESPWAALEDATLTAVADRETVVLSAELVRDIAAAHAERDRKITAAGAMETRLVSQAIAETTLETGKAGLELERAIAEVAASTAKANAANLPDSSTKSAEWDKAGGNPGSVEGTSKALPVAAAPQSQSQSPPKAKPEDMQAQGATTNPLTPTREQPVFGPQPAFTVKREKPAPKSPPNYDLPPERMTPHLQAQQAAVRRSGAYIEQKEKEKDEVIRQRLEALKLTAVSLTRPQLRQLESILDREFSRGEYERFGVLKSTLAAMLAVNAENPDLAERHRDDLVEFEAGLHGKNRAASVEIARVERLHARIDAENAVRFSGAMQGVGGLVEAVGGFLLVPADVAAGTKVLAIVMIVHGSDNARAGFLTTTSGKSTPTVNALVMAEVFKKLDYTDENALKLGSFINDAESVLLPLGILAFELRAARSAAILESRVAAASIAEARSATLAEVRTATNEMVVLRAGEKSASPVAEDVIVIVKVGKDGALAPNGVGTYTTKIRWGIHDIDARPHVSGYWGKRIPQSDPRVDAFELKINPNNESYYLPHPDGGFVQFENLTGLTLQDGKLVVKPRSFFHVDDLPAFAKNKVMGEAERQIAAARLAGLQVEWLVTDQNAVSQLDAFFKAKGVSITVIFIQE